MAKDIAIYLKLPNPGQYTGHCFRLSSVTLLVNTSGDLLTLKRHGVWRFNAVAEGYIDDSTQNKIQISNKIVASIKPSRENSTILADSELPSRSTSFSLTENIFKKIEIPGIKLENCSNITMNYNFK